MPYTGCALTLPLGSDYEEQATYSDMIMINIDDDQNPEKIFEGQQMIHDAVNRSKPTQFNRINFFWVMIRWHLPIFLALTASLYATFYYGFQTDQKEKILKAFAFCANWMQLAFFLGIYNSFAVKKVQDVISVSLCLSDFILELKISRKL